MTLLAMANVPPPLGPHVVRTLAAVCLPRDFRRDLAFG